MSYSVRFKDYSGENSTFSVQTDPASEPTPVQMTALYTNLGNMTVGTQGDGVLTVKTTNDTGNTNLPANTNAQRELKYLVSYTSDVTGEQYSVSIPTADTALIPQGSDSLDLTNATVAAFVSAFEDVTKKKEGNNFNDVTVVGIKLVGRNN